MCPLSVSELPSEILEQILLSLPPVEILGMREVCHLFLDLISTSQYLQHRIDLFSAGLVDNPNTACSLAERRARLHKYTDGWKDTESSVQYDCHLKNQVAALSLVSGSQNLFSAYTHDRTAVCFIHLPVSPSQGTVKEWTLGPSLKFDSCVACPQDNLLAIIEQGLSFVNIRLLNLLNGLPHEIPSHKIITLGLGDWYNPRAISSQISGSRIALLIAASNPSTLTFHTELVIWDWKTGGIVLRYTTDDAVIGRMISFITAVYFLEGPWLLTLCNLGPTPQLLILNTLLPLQDRRGWRILGLPQLSSIYRYYSVISQSGKPLTELPEFLVDPAQRIFVLASQDKQALVTPVELLIQRIHSVRTDPYTPWDEWAEDVVTIHLHPDTHSLQLFDMKVLELCCSPFRPGWSVQMYDFSKSGQRDIQIQEVNDGAGGGYRGVLSTPNWSAQYPMEHRDSVPHEAQLVGNKLVCLDVRTSSTRRACSLNVWELG